MTPEQFESFMTSQRELYKLNRQILAVQTQQLKLQEKIARQLDKLLNDRPIKDPDYQKSLADYPNFDWNSIDAKIIAKDGDGVSAVEWQGRIYKRRAPENKFAPAIWFSRHDGFQKYKNKEGFKDKSCLITTNNIKSSLPYFLSFLGEQYHKLITFRTIEAAEPISRKVLAQLNN